MDRRSAEYYDQIADKLYTAILADIMDGLGYRNQVMRYDIRPIYPDARIVGRAATMLGVQAYVIPPEPYALELELLDDLKPGEVVVCAIQGEKDSSIWGELLSTCVRARGGRGAIIDGMTRDAWGIVAMKFPVFATGLNPADSKGRSDVVAIRKPVKVGGVLVQNGDLVMADSDGVVVVPQEIEEQAIREGFKKAADENRVRDLLAQGESVRKMFKEHGIL